MNLTGRPNAVVLQSNIFPWTVDRPRAQARMGGLNSIDGSFLPFLIEELLAYSVGELVVPETSAPGLFIDQLPETLVPFVRVVDTRSAFDSCTAFLEPVLQEFRVRIEPDGITTHGVSPHDPLFYQLYELLRYVETFIVGLQNHAAIDFGCEKLKQTAAAVRSTARNPETRRILAELEGVLNTYELVSIPGLIALPSAVPDHVERFRRTLHDSDYADLSLAAYNVGIPAKVRRAVQTMKTKVRRILGRESHRQLFDLGGRLLTASTQVPAPTASLVQALLGSSPYLPPDLSFSSILADARRNWLTADPECVPIPEFQHRLRAMNPSDARPRHANPGLFGSELSE